MTELKIKDKDIVVPGQIVAKGIDNIPGKGCFREKEQIISKIIGLANIKGRVINIIPLVGKYMPKRDDEVVGVVTDVTSTGWQVDIGAPYSAYLPMSEYSRDYIDKRTDPSTLLSTGDIVYVRVIKFTKAQSLLVSTRGPKYRKLHNGLVIKITPQKVPRIIGKKGSMINLIKKATDTNIIVGPNGWVWIQGKDPEKELRAIEIIEFVEQHSHEQGLTEKIEKQIK